MLRVLPSTASFGTQAECHIQVSMAMTESLALLHTQLISTQSSPGVTSQIGICTALQGTSLQTYM